MSITCADPWEPGLSVPDGDSEPALELAGRHRTRGEFAQAVDLLAGGVGGIRRFDARVAPPADVLAAVFAGARARRPVVVGGGPLPVGRVPRAAFLLVSTSGSSATPRRVLRTLRSWTASHPAYTELTGLTTGDRLLLTGPLSSTLQLFAAVHALAIGAVVTDDPATATHAVCVPAALPQVMAQAPRVRSVVVAGARLSEQLAHRASAGGIDVAEYYGAAELSFVAARRWPARLTPFPGVEIDLRGGELWSRSPYQAIGAEGASAGFRRDAAGFATVGDLADRAEDGTLTIRGRGAEAVLVGGRTVLVEDVESTIASLPAVVEVAVAPCPHPRLGATLVALVVTDDPLELAGVREQARTVLQGEWFPRRWRRIEAVPRTSGGKIDRRAVHRLVSS